ncbi:TetR/AcrR family transcriptional regulator [Brevibacillus fluminis]|uniref:TetR/AcrR family transcriptional regulator n=1 Tax=Brevibacillus fluminis TaxID=511487 RepID=A0A3M8DUN7_9BACL|nr:TetR/AcrR family transcriptional regulator [Brevibacillus fluminis]RNB90687.1 TetR/AcrR family transcriptional regulator [Brevibacillus fluminis]
MNQEKHQHIVNAAKQAFQHFGYKATTLEQIAKYANIGKGTFYNFFKTKEEVLQFIVEEELVKLNRFAEETMQSEPPQIEMLHNYLYTCMLYRKEHDLFCKLAQEVDAFGTPEAAMCLRRLEEAGENQLKEIIHFLVDKNVMESCDVELTAFIIRELYAALVYKWEKQHEPLSLDRISSLFRQYVRPGLGQREVSLP